MYNEGYKIFKETHIVDDLILKEIEFAEQAEYNLEITHHIF